LEIDTRNSQPRPGSNLTAAVATAAAANAAAGNHAATAAAAREEGAAGADAQAQVYLVRLRSYEHMGRAAVECVGGCTCEGSVMENGWDHPTSIFEAYAFKVSYKSVSGIS
jgi:hypothetical protein